MTSSSRSERAIVLTVALVQFVNVLEFMIVMPLGPDFARDLGIDQSHIGWIGGAYTAAGAIAGLLGAFVLDRFDRRSALVLTLLGLIAGTFVASFAQGFASLMAARVLAGMFGGPASSIALSIVADVVPVERRGRAMGVVMGAFALSSILGVPLGLELASQSGWRAPFYAVGALGVLTAFVTWWRLPSMRGHLEHIQRHASLASVAGLFARSEVRLAWLLTAAVMASNFLLIPNISAFIQSNLGYPREHLSRLYCIGGVASLVAMAWAGKLTDRYGATRVAAPTSVAIGAVIAAWFIPEATRLPVIVLFVLFMVTTSSRGVAYQALTSRVPGPGERASYMSVQSSIAHMACALGAFASSVILEEGSDGRLEHVNLAGWLALAMVLTTPWIYARLERALDRRTRAALDLDAKAQSELESVPPI